MKNMKETRSAESRLNKDRILFFDGVCGLCSALVDFALPKFSEGQISFAPLQGPTARELLSPRDLGLEYVVYYRDQKIYRKTEAVAYLLGDIGGAYKPISIMLRTLPRFITDFFYDLVARYRYRIFGKSETCRLPTPQERKFFLD
ncbi:thiol-disulfide oxidoreductase [Bdellovibrio sp. qaytius]|nr:thiol-disulfide oxidoreductase [Bdellovibrio sp. qaytius]